MEKSPWPSARAVPGPSLPWVHILAMTANPTALSKTANGHRDEGNAIEPPQPQTRHDPLLLTPSFWQRSTV